MLKLPLAVLAVLVGLLGLTPAVDAVSPVEQVTSSAPRPRNLTVTAQSTSSISINWQTGFGAETSPNGFIVSIRRTHPAPVEPIGTPKCPELWRSWRTPRATQFPTECVIDGLQPGAYYEIQVMESPNGENSAPATAWSGTFVPGVENLQVEVDWKADGSDIVATWKLPTDMKNIDSSYARFFTADNRMVWSCYRNVAQTGRCKFSEVVDGDYRVEVRTTGGYGSEPISKKVTVERPIQDAKDLEPSYYWHSDIPGQMFLNLSWTHIAATGTNSYTASATGRTCTALASATPERLSCDIALDTDNISFPISAIVEGGSATADLSIEAPPAKPRNPSKTRAGEIGRNSAVISWEHKAGSNATTYSVWIRDVAATCTVSAPFNGRQSCRLDGLNPGTSYTANVYAENAIGRRSVRTDRVKFTTAAPPPPPPPPPPPVDKERPDEATTTTTSTTTTIKTVVIRDLDPECVGRGGHVRKHEKATKRANRKFNKGIDKVTKKFESRPAKLAKKIKRITKRRDRRIARANTEFDVSCPAPTS